MFGFLKKKTKDKPDIPQVNWHVIPDKYTNLVVQLEENAQQDPATYRRKLMGLAFLGYGYLLGIMFLTMAVIVGMIMLIVLKPSGGGIIIAKKLTIPLIILLYVILTALWVKLDEPDHGIEIQEKDSPDLFAFLKDMQDKVDGPKIYKVFLTDELNASIIQHAAHGIFGKHRNYLFLGVRLMKVLTPEQCKAVIAHEYGHIVGGDGRFSNWIFRARETWGNVANKMFLEEKWGGFIFRRFFKWYVPYFNAYSFVLARKQEYLADAFAANMVSPDAIGQSLVSIRIRNYEMQQQFFDQYWRDSETQPAPSRDMLSALTDFWRGSRDEEKWATVLKDNLEYDTGLQDTHPSLAARLQAVGVAPNLPSDDIENNAAVFFFKDNLESYKKQFWAEWWDNVKDHWEERFQNAERGRADLKRLSESYNAAPDKMDELDMLDYADLSAWLEGEDKAKPLYKKILENNPAQGRANFEYGFILLKEGDKSGMTYIAQSVKTSESNAIAVYERAGGVMWNMGLEDEVKHYGELAQKWYEIQDKAEEERNVLLFSDTFIPHNLTAENVQDVVKAVKKYDLITEAFLVQKECEYLAEKRPLYILAVYVDKQKARALTKTGSAVSQFLAENLEFNYGEAFYLNLSDKGNKKFLDTIPVIDGAKIY